MKHGKPIAFAAAFIMVAGLAGCDFSFLTGRGNGNGFATVEVELSFADAVTRGTALRDGMPRGVNDDLGVGQIRFDALNTDWLSVVTGGGPVTVTEKTNGVWRVALTLDAGGMVRFTAEALDVTGVTTLYEGWAAINVTANASVVVAMHPFAPLVAEWLFDGGTLDDTAEGSHPPLTRTAVSGGFADDRFVPVDTNAYEFDGTAEFVLSTTDSAHLDFSTSFTLCAWIYTLQTGTGLKGIVGKTGTDGTSLAYGLFLDTASGRLATLVNGAAPGEENLDYGQAVVNDGAWHFVAMAVDTGLASRQVRLYVDGALDGAFDAALSGAVQTLPGEEASLGTLYYGSATPLNYAGLIDDVRAYGGSLSPEALDSLYHEGGWTASGTADGLVARWELDGDGLDSTVHIYNGTVTGAATAPDRFGYEGSALEFNGDGTSVSAGPYEGLDLDGVSFTVSAWFAPSLIQDDRTIVSFGNEMGQFILGVSATGAPFAVMGATRIGLESGPMVPNEWYLITATFMGDSLDLYLDAATQTGNRSLSPLSNTTGTPLVIGAGGLDCFDASGLIDDVRVYDYPLTQEEIQALFYAGGWKLDDGSGGEVLQRPSRAKLYAEWLFESVDGSAVYDTGGRAETLTASLCGLDQPDRLGTTSSAYLDGTENSYLYNADIGLLGDEYSVSIWVKFDWVEPGSWTSIISELDGATIVYRLGLGQYESNYGYITWEANGVTIQKTDVVAVKGTWYHIVATVSGDGQALYVDGGTPLTGIAGTAPSITLPVLVVGTESLSTHLQNLDGQVDDIRLYSTALNAWDVSALYHEKDFGCDPELASDFTFLMNYEGNEYWLSKGTTDWVTARDDCVIAGGHLATIGSWAEDVALCTRLGLDHYYIGLAETGTDTALSWATGQLDTYRGWEFVEPDLQAGIQVAAYIDGDYDGWWSVQPAVDYAYYIIEFNGGLNQTPAPVDSSFTCGLPVASTTITLNWNDVETEPVPDGYLIKWSYDSLSAIPAPVDGTPESNGDYSHLAPPETGSVDGYVVTVPDSRQACYFKIWSYTGYGDSIKYAASPASAQRDFIPSTIVVLDGSIGWGSWTVPSGITSIEVWLVGAGGGGCGSDGGGGGGGAGEVVYVPSITVVPDSSVSYWLGSGGAGSMGEGSSGESSWIVEQYTYYAAGGLGASTANAPNAAGGTGGGGTAGGSGGAGAADAGAGGGGGGIGGVAGDPGLGVSEGGSGGNGGLSADASGLFAVLDAADPVRPYVSAGSGGTDGNLGGDATGYGCGGGGAGNTATQGGHGYFGGGGGGASSMMGSGTGGNGGQGFIVIRY